MRRRRISLGFGIMSVSCMLSFSLGKIVGAAEVKGNETAGRREAVVAVLESETVNAADVVQQKPEVVVGEKVELPKVDRQILLVNKKNQLPEDFEVELIVLADGVNKAAKEAYEPLCAMLQAGRKEGLKFEICSSYRDVDRQRELFEEDLENLIRAGYSYQDAYTEVEKETMPPGYSEHSTGLAFDIVALDYQMLDAGQEKTEENKWLQKHCAEYGFILRYPEGKEEITGISYESWHFRYVGPEAAEYIMENGITLEEYLEQDSEEK